MFSAKQTYNNFCWSETVPYPMSSEITVINVAIKYLKQILKVRFAATLFTFRGMSHLVTWSHQISLLIYSNLHLKMWYLNYNLHLDYNSTSLSLLALTTCADSMMVGLSCLLMHLASLVLYHCSLNSSELMGNRSLSFPHLK